MTLRVHDKNKKGHSKWQTFNPTTLKYKSIKFLDDPEKQYQCHVHWVKPKLEAPFIKAMEELSNHD